MGSAAYAVFGRREEEVTAAATLCIFKQRLRARVEDERLLCHGTGRRLLASGSVEEGRSPKALVEGAPQAEDAMLSHVPGVAVAELVDVHDVRGSVLVRYDDAGEVLLAVEASASKAGLLVEQVGPEVPGAARPGGHRGQWTLVFQEAADEVHDVLERTLVRHARTVSDTSTLCRESKWRQFP